MTDLPSHSSPTIFHPTGTLVAVSGDLDEEPGGSSSLLDLLVGRPAWHRDAACTEHPEVTFLPPRGAPPTWPAKAVCSACLVRAERLDFEDAMPPRPMLGDFVALKSAWGVSVAAVGVPSTRSRIHR